jgi:hypothetical protein
MLSLLLSSLSIDHDLQAVQSKTKMRLQFYVVHGGGTLEMCFCCEEVLLAVTDDALTHLEVVLKA